MITRNRLLSALLGLGALALLAGCQQSFETVSPNEFGMILTPTGFQNDILKPGGYDIGTEEQSGKGNKLYLVDGSLIGVKESFVIEEGEDHRCSMKGAQPLVLDVRFTFAIPDVNAPDGPKHLARLMSLSRAVAVEGKTRVFRINPQEVYENQAKQEVRGKIRQLCASFATFEEAEASFIDNSENGMTAKIEAFVREVLAENKVPLTLLSAQPSNMKPDQTVVDANSAQIAADARVKAVEVVVNYLADDPTGRRWDVYRLQTMAAIAKDNPNAMFLDLNTTAPLIPLPVK